MRANRYSGKARVESLYQQRDCAGSPIRGSFKWYYQEIPKDVWDYDSSYECLLIDREVRGVMRKLLVHINKSGLRVGARSDQWRISGRVSDRR